MANMKRSDQYNKGRYSQGGKVSVLGGGTRLGWWERKVLPKDSSDVPFTITPKYKYRPDRLAYDIYGDSELQWFVMQYNNVTDLFVDFNVGKVVSLPTKTRLYTELLSKS